jgi:hypothetical protein
MAPPQRPTGVTLGSIYLIVMGVLLALAGAACGIFGGALGTAQSQLPGAGFLGGAVLVIGLILLVLGILQIAAGAGALGGKGWGRWTGIIVAAILAVLSILSAVSALGTDVTSAIVTLIIGVLYALTAWAFIQASAFFAARR